MALLHYMLMESFVDRDESISGVSLDLGRMKTLW
jgi:hypothetical protein